MSTVPSNASLPPLPLRLKRRLKLRLAAVPWLLFPGLCRFCDRPSGRDIDLCVVCEADLPWLGLACARCAHPQREAVAHCARCIEQAPALDRTLAALLYAEPIDALVADVKFHGRPNSAPLLGALLAHTIASGYAAQPFPEVVIPVPLSRWRLLWRGHDQAALIGRALVHSLASQGTWLQLAPGLLQRARHTRAQSGESADARRHNLAGAFVARPSLPYRHVALLDDVFTTGATLNAAARALRAAGVTRVDAWAVARTPRTR